MIPRDVAELLDELWLITRRLDGPDRHDARGYIDSIRSALTRAFGERVLECSHGCMVDGLMGFGEPARAIDVNGHMECPVCKDRNHLRVRER